MKKNDNDNIVNKYICEICCQELLIQNKNRHEKSKKHMKNFESKRGCPICYEPFKNKKEYETCPTCKNYWCKICDKKIDKCPFCREKIRELPTDDNIVIDSLIENMVNQITAIIQTVRNSNDTLYYYIYDTENDSVILNVYTTTIDPSQLIRDIQNIQNVQFIENLSEQN